MPQLQENQLLHDRKLEHLRIVREENVEPVPSPLGKYRLPYKALPQLDLKKVDTRCEFLGYKLAMPFLVAGMTGGPEAAGLINRNLALACEQEKVALGLGSMRVVLKDPTSIGSFQVKKYCPSVPLLANMGLVQLNYGYGLKKIETILKVSKADAICLHVNHLQEAVQPEGDTNFAGLVEKLAKILPKISKPVIIKEVGSGIDAGSAQMLADIGIKWIDVSGLGGTSWTVVEAYRRQDDLGFVFGEEGIPVDEALIQCREIKGINLIASGGIRTGLDIAKGLVLGADMCAAAKPLLAAAMDSPESCVKVLQRFKRELAVAMFTAGVGSVSELKFLKLKLK